VFKYRTKHTANVCLFVVFVLVSDTIVDHKLKWTKIMSKKIYIF
jgi:hypothetical protein